MVASTEQLVHVTGQMAAATEEMKSVSVEMKTISEEEIDRNKIQRVIDLYNRYFSQEYLRARYDSWFWLVELEHNNKPESFVWSSLWGSSSQKDRDQSNEVYKILSFFYTIYTLDKQGLIDRKLAIDLFGYQFKHWRNCLTPLAQNTFKYDNDKDDIFGPYLSPKEIRAALKTPEDSEEDSDLDDKKPLDWLDSKTSTFDPMAARFGVKR